MQNEGGSSAANKKKKQKKKKAKAKKDLVAYESGDQVPAPCQTLGSLLEGKSPDEPEKAPEPEDLDFSLSSSDNEIVPSNQNSLKSVDLSEGECSGSE